LEVSSSRGTRARHPISGSFGTSCGKAKAEVEVEVKAEAEAEVEAKTGTEDCHSATSRKL
jgi:hypothetical protein